MHASSSLACNSISKESITVRTAAAILILITSIAVAAQQQGGGGDRAPVSKAQVVEWMKSISTWGKWGKDDQLGAVNYITPATRRRAAALVRTGEVVSLARPVVLQKRH